MATNEATLAALRAQITRTIAALEEADTAIVNDAEILPCLQAVSDAFHGIAEATAAWVVEVTA